jgi:hypothetical protein
MTNRTSALIAAAILELVVFFQLALILGAPLGEYTQGGQTVGELATSGKLLAGVSVAIVSVMIFGLLALAELGPLKSRSAKFIRNLNRFTFGYAALGTVMNLISRSPKERYWAIVTLTVAILTWSSIKKK